MIIDLVKFILRHIVTLVVTGFIVVMLIFVYYSHDLPGHDTLKQYYPPSITRIYSADGKLIEEYAREKRVFVPIESIPQNLLYAFVSAEDKNFYDHYGIDLIGILRAFSNNVVNFFTNKGIEGGSTITQQVVKNFLLTSERSIERKIKEAILALRISRIFSKDKIAELYLNQIFLGKGSYGVAMAALNYFNKSIDELTLSECAVLASLPKAPSRFNPAVNYDRALLRKNYILDRMYEDGYITSDQLKEAKAEPITLRKYDKVMTIDADYYASRVRQEVISMFNEEYFYTAGLTIITCLDSETQKASTNALRHAIKKYDMKKGYRGPIAQKIDLENWHDNLNKIMTPRSLLHYKLAAVLDVQDDEALVGLQDASTVKIYLKDSQWAATNLSSLKNILKEGQVIVVENRKNKYFLQQIPEVNGGFMVMDHNNGRVLASQGGYDFDTSRYDRTSQAKRQVGSLVKPFVYLAGLEKGLNLNDIFEDEPIAIEQGVNLPLWEPQNYERDFIGPITMRRGFERSRNIISIKVGLFAGIPAVRDALIKLGVNDNPPPYYSIFLGAMETTLSRMLNAFGQIANGGYKIEPHYIELIKDRFGKVIYKRDYSECIGCSSGQKSFGEELLPVVISKKSKKLINSDVNYQMISLMKGSVARGTSRRVSVIKTPLAGKTGTTNEAKDTWFVGFTPEIVAATYIGYDNPRGLGDKESGATVALPAFVHFMQHSKYRHNKKDFAIPSTVYFEKVDLETGELSEKDGSISEVFRFDSKGYRHDIKNPPHFEKEQNFQDLESYDFSQEIY